MNPVGLQTRQNQPIAFGRTEVIETGSREILGFLLKDVPGGFRQAYKDNFLKKYNVQIQEQADNKNLVGIIVSGFQKMKIDHLTSAYAKATNPESATKIILAKNKYVNGLYENAQKAKKDTTQINTFKDLRHNFPV